MKQIQMKTSIASSTFSYACRKVLTVGVDVAPDEAERWVNGGIATWVAASTPERAVREPSETAVAPHERTNRKQARRKGGNANGT